MGLFSNSVPALSVTGMSSSTEPYPGQTRALTEHSVEETGNRECCKVLKGKEKQEEKRRSFGKRGWQGFGAEAGRPPAHSGEALSTASALCGRAVCACPSLCPAARSQLKRILITAVSSSRAFKNRFKRKCLSVFPSTLQARKFHPARPSPKQTPPPLCCPQRGLYNLRVSLGDTRGFIQERDKELSG